MFSKSEIIFFIKLTVWCAFWYIPQALFHESGHMWFGMLFGYKINYMKIGLWGAYVNMSYVFNPKTHLIVLYMGGITSAFILYYIYHTVKDLGVEFSISVLFYSLLNIELAILETFFTSYYNSKPMSMILSHFFVFLIPIWIHRKDTPFHVLKS